MWRQADLMHGARREVSRARGDGGLSRVSVEVMTTGVETPARTSQGINAADSCTKMGDVWYANYISIKLFSFKNRHIPPSAHRTDPVLMPSGRKLMSQHGGRAVSRAAASSLA